MKKSIFFAAAMFVLMLVSAFSMQAQDVVKWNASVQMTSKNEGVIILTATMQDGWHVYGFNQSDDGPIATAITFTAPKGVKYQGKMTMSKAPVSLMDDMFGVEVTYWEGSVTFKRKFKLHGVKKANVEVSVSYMACNDSNCQPPKTETFNLEIKK